MSLEEKRHRGKEAFILVGDLIDPEYSTNTADLLLFNINKKKPIFIRHVKDVMESNNLLVATAGLGKMINEDPRLGDHLESYVVERVVKILEEGDNVIQRSAAFILSRVKNDIRGTIIREKAIPVLVGLMSSKDHNLAIAVLITLTRLACISSDYVSVILDKGALEVARNIAGGPDHRTRIKENMARFMAVVCRAKLLPDKERLAVTILDELLQRNLLSFRHIERACFALSYLSYERHVEIKQETLKRLIRFLSHSDNTVVASALGVLGNIVRWGNSDQIEILAKDTEFLPCLGTFLLVSKPKKFQLEACHIISKIAAQSLTSTQDVQKANLIDLLNKLLEVDDSDVKIEAKCAISAVTMHGYQQGWSQDIC